VSETGEKGTTVCIDAIITRGTEVLLIRRKYPPFKGMWAFPGGKLEPDETLEECLVREVKEETGLDVIEFEQVDIRDQPDRDPRGRYVSVVYRITEYDGEVRAGDDASHAEFVVIDRDAEMAFDHKQILDKFYKFSGE